MSGSGRSSDSGDGSVHVQHRSSSKENAESSYAKSANTQVTSTHTENEHETWRFPLRKRYKTHLQTRPKPFLDCFQVGFLFKRVSTYPSESNPIVLQLVTVLRADLWQKIQDFSVRLRKRRFFDGWWWCSSLQESWLKNGCISQTLMIMGERV